MLTIVHNALYRPPWRFPDILRLRSERLLGFVSGRSFVSSPSRPLESRGTTSTSWVYLEEEPGRRPAAKLITRHEARRIAAKIAKLPDQE